MLPKTQAGIREIRQPGSEVRYCYTCWASETRAIDMTAHEPGDPVNLNEVPATCTADGSCEETVFCSICRAVLSTEVKTIPAAGHSWSEWTETKAPTETTEGEETREPIQDTREPEAGEEEAEEPTRREIEDALEDTELLILYMSDGMEEITDTLVYLKDIVSDRDLGLILINDLFFGSLSGLLRSLFCCSLLNRC